MRTRNLIEGIVMLSIGIGSLIAALIAAPALDDVMYHLTGYCSMFGILSIGRYLYWNLPKNRAAREKILYYENIEQNDELQVRIRDQAGRIANEVGVYALCAAIFIADILDQLEIIQDAGITILILAICLALQLIAQWISLRHITKKFK